MAVPKKKTSKARSRSRRANWKLSAPNLVPCPRCRQPKLPHQACPHCGYYKDRQVLALEEEA
ncbi:MAG: 50S ribosomal protein L32 [Bacillota bacterium]|nr:50S ribosomal protein L32 [Bacillota bacterium]